MVSSATMPDTFCGSSLPPAKLQLGKGNIVWRRRHADVALHTSRRFSAIIKSSEQGGSLRSGIIKTQPPGQEWQKNFSELQVVELPHQKLNDADEIWRKVGQVKEIFWRMGDGEITSSAYDTAWVAMIPAITGRDGGPQFSSSLQWIIENQMDNGSWGDKLIFTAHDRIMNTLACVVALKSWNICANQCDKGLLFLKDNIWRLAEENEEVVLIGFEIAFPSLIDIAKGLGLNLPYDDPTLQDIYAKRDLQLNKIPREVMHEMPTTLLYSLEGMGGLQWDKLLQLQCKEGSILFSPSSTAYALMKTGDHNCLRYLQNIVHKFNGGVPNVYPIDLFEHLWIVDRLQRLGISRFFEAEIKNCMDYVSRYWTEKGICWARNSAVKKLEETAMAFRLLRLHGYTVSPDVFRHFEKEDKFFCLAEQPNQAVRRMYSLNRASQLKFSGEKILEKAYKFSSDFLMEKKTANQLIDQWIIMKDLPGEVEYTLDFPFHASLPRVEARWYLEQYGGSNDVWIGKTLYRMPYVNNDLYLELAKADFNHCQSIHQLEWIDLQRWHKEHALEAKGVSWRSMLKAYFLATASIFEPERSAERLGWVRTAVLTDAVTHYFCNESCTDELRQLFLRDFSSYQLENGSLPLDLVGSIMGLLDLLTATSDKNYRRQLPPQFFRQLLRWRWEEWISTWTGKDENRILLLVRTIELCAGRVEPKTELARHEYSILTRLTTSICKNLRVVEGNMSKIDSVTEAEMKELVKCVLQNSNGLSKQTKQTFLSIARSYIYTAHCSSSTLNKHITKVLFEPVE